MFKRLVGLAGCLRGKHERSQAKIQKRGEDYFSRCRYCGVRMKRRSKRDWIVDRSRRTA